MTSDKPTPPWEFDEPACAEVGTEIFFPPDRDDPRQVRMEDTTREAKKICQGCKHLTECAEWALTREPHGVWGGMSPTDRRNLRQKLGIRIYTRNDADGTFRKVFNRNS